MDIGCGAARAIGCGRMDSGAFFVVFVGVYLYDDMYIKAL